MFKLNHFENKEVSYPEGGFENVTLSAILHYLKADIELIRKYFAFTYNDCKIKK